MDCSGLSLLMLTILTGVSCQQLTAVEDEVSSLEGTATTLSYSYPKLSSSDYFFWYRQDPGKPPELLISHSASGIIGVDQQTGVKIHVSGTQLDLMISSAAVTDSAVYYCAVRPSGGFNKILFGPGTRLTVEPKEKVPPEFYFLEGEEKTSSVCLATGFSKENGTEGNFTESGFNPTKPARNLKDRDSLDFEVYSQVAFMDDRTQCEGSKTTETPECEATLEPDNIVNLASLTIYCLRLIFIKTVVFNVLMTLRLWVSQ